MIACLGAATGIRNTNNGVGTGAITLPTGNVGDLMILHAVNSYPKTWSTPSGWTAIETSAAGNTTGMGTWYKIAASGDTTVSPTWSTGNSPCVATVTRYAGVNTSILPTATNRHGFTTTGTSSATESETSSVPPSLSAAGPYDLFVDCWVLGCANTTGNTHSGTKAGNLVMPGAPADWSLRASNGTVTGNSSSVYNCGLVVADRAGAVDRPTITALDDTGATGEGAMSFGNWYVFSVALAAARPPGDQFMPFFGV